jgi:hypothetical protein
MIRRVADAVGAEGDERLDVVGGGDAEAAQSAQLADGAAASLRGCKRSFRSVLPEPIGLI